MNIAEVTFRAPIFDNPKLFAIAFLKMIISNIVHGPGYRSSPTFERDLENITVDEYLIQAAKQRHDTIYLTDISNGEELTSNEFIQKSYKLAAELQALGCGKGTIVGIMSENRLEYSIIVLGTILAGSTLTCFNPAYTAHEMEHVYNIAKPTVMFCSTENYHKIKQLNPSSLKFIFLDSNDTLSGLKLSQLTESTKPYTHVKNRPNDIAFILYSSGTTGLPKGVMLTHKNIIYMSRINIEELPLMMPQEDISLIDVIVIPMFHAAGLMNLLQAIHKNKTAVMLRKFDAKQYLSAIQKYKVKSLGAVPTLTTFLLKNPIVDEYDLSSLKSIVCGAAPIKAQTELAIKKKFKLHYVRQVYGMTEATLGITFKNPNSSKDGTVGSPIPGTHMKVVHPETKKLLGKNEVGEICFKGPSVMKGYFGNEKATAETIDRDGWVHTGDLGYYDDDGDFYIVDRVKELIKYKGFQVAPAEIEGILLTHPAIADSAVIGIPDELAGELPRAYVVRKAGASVTEDEIKGYVAEKVSPQKRLTGGVEFVEEIPRNPSGKILRRKLRELLIVKQFLRRGGSKL